MQIKSITDHVGTRDEKPFKSTLFSSKNILLGTNCLQPGQQQAVHTHSGQDKFYAVQSGRGLFTIGDEQLAGKAGDVIWAAADVPHGVTNDGEELLVLLIGITPWR